MKIFIPIVFINLNPEGRVCRVSNGIFTGLNSKKGIHLQYNAYIIKIIVFGFVSIVYL